MAKKKVVEADRDELAMLIADSLNKLNKEQGQVAFFLDGKMDTPVDLKDFVSTGATMLDIAVSNRPHGGIAVGRITELQGLEASGKSLICANIIANAQKQGGVGIFIDTENATNSEFFKSFGIDTSKFLSVNLTTIEDIFESIVNIIEKVRTNPEQKDKLLVIVVDSVSGASTKREVEASFNKEGYGMDKAYLISLGMRKITNVIGKQKIALIFTNQLRVKVDSTPFGEKYTTSGGKAIGYHASTRIRLVQMGKIKNNEGEIIGTKVQATVFKNRIGPPHRVADFEIYFNRGIDDTNAWLNKMKDTGLVKQAGAWYTYTDPETGEETRFQSKELRGFLEADEERKELIYQAICDSIIMKYETDFDPETVNFTNEVDDE